MSWNGIDPTDLRDLETLGREWVFPSGTTYLNHGSFGPPPRVVRQARRAWIDRLDDQPMQFYVREWEPAWLAARERLASFIGATPSDLTFVENATYGMNAIADGIPLQSGDEVLLNNHEYGAVRRIWNRACKRVGAQVVEANIPLPITDSQTILERLDAAITPRTRWLVISHITSATAITMPVRAIVTMARTRNIGVIVDGPHAVAHESLDLDALGADFYTASCHKWLCGPLGSGFLYARPDRHELVRPVLLSWGRILPALPQTWDEEFRWTGTRDPSPYLTIPTSIEFLESFGIDRFRRLTHAMAREGRRALEDLLGTQAFVPDDDRWYGSMAEVPLPPGDWTHLQNWLWHRHGIEIPIIHFDNQWFIRLSCHLYTRRAHLDRLLDALESAITHPQQLKP